MYSLGHYSNFSYVLLRRGRQLSCDDDVSVVSIGWWPSVRDSGNLVLMCFGSVHEEVRQTRVADGFIILLLPLPPLFFDGQFPIFYWGGRKDGWMHGVSGFLPLFWTLSILPFQPSNMSWFRGQKSYWWILASSGSAFFLILRWFKSGQVAVAILTKGISQMTSLPVDWMSCFTAASCDCRLQPALWWRTLESSLSSSYPEAHTDFHCQSVRLELAHLCVRGKHAASWTTWCSSGNFDPWPRQAVDIIVLSLFSRLLINCKKSPALPRIISARWGEEICSFRACPYIFGLVEDKGLLSPLTSGIDW